MKKLLITTIPPRLLMVIYASSNAHGVSPIIPRHIINLFHHSETKQCLMMAIKR